MYRALTEDERDLVRHVGMWGAPGYPIRKLGKKWIWEFRSIKGPPVCFRTKREAIASFEAYWSFLRELLGQEAYERAVAEGRAA